MKKIKNILVPIDGSRNSLRALESAITIAKPAGATITGMYVVDAPRVLDYGVIQSVKHDLFESGKKILKKAKLLSEKNGLTFKEKITLGNPDNDIVAYSKILRPDFIVIGSRGLGGVKEVFLGSVSNHVMHKSLMPVLIVK